MMEFFIFIYLEPFTDGLLGFFVGVFVWAVTLLVLGGIGFGVYCYMDTPTEWHPGTFEVHDVLFTPAYTTHSTVMVGKVFVPQTQHHPDTWTAAGLLKLEDGSKVVYQDNFGVELNKGQTYGCSYGYGRLSKRLRMK